MLYMWTNVLQVKCFKSCIFVKLLYLSNVLAFMFVQLLKMNFAFIDVTRNTISFCDHT